MSFLSGLPVLRGLAPRDRRAVLLGAAVLLPALLWLFALRPYRNYLDELNERVAAERALLQREQALLARANALPRAVAAAEAEARRAEMLLVRAPNAPLAEAELTSYLQSVATLSRVLLEDIRSVESRRKESFPGDVRPIRLAISGESDLDGTINFLNRMEGSPLLIRVRELLLEPVLEADGRGDGRSEATGVMKFTFTIESFAPPDSTAAIPNPQRQDQAEPEGTS